MYKKTIEYEDFNGNKLKEDFYFNFTKAELAEWEMSTPGEGLAAYLQSIVDSNDKAEITRLFKKVILDAYGEKSEDGKRFIKSEEISKAFEQTNAYDEFFMELVADEEAAANFINSIVPSIEEKKLPKAVS